MKRLILKNANALQRRVRVRSRVHGTAKRPRLSVSISNRHVTAQLVDDEAMKTLVHVATESQKAAQGTMTEKCVWVGTEISKKAKTAKINKVVLDRGARLYHGRIKALAEAARAGGLEF